MLFEDITLIDETYQARTHQYLLTEGKCIKSLGDTRPEGYSGACYQGKNKVLVPGFFNLHCHVPMTFLRGYGEGLPLDRWLFEKIFPFEALLTDEDVYWGSLLGCAEQIQSGAVGFTDMYSHIAAVADAVEESGLKANLSNGSTAFDGKLRYNEESRDYRELTALMERLHGGEHDRIRADLSIHGEYTSYEGFVRECAAFGKEHHLRMHLHLSETKKEHEECKARHGGKTPARYFEECGVFDLPTTAAHCVWLEEEDINVLARHDVTAVHCPSSNLKLGSGLAPVRAMLERGVRVGVGTDGASSNNNLNVLEEINLASLLQKGVNHDPMLLNPRAMLELACRNGALAQGRADCGCIKVGNRADLLVFDLDKPHLQPVYDVLSNLLYAAQAGDLCLNMTDGEVLYRDGVFPRIDLERVMFEVGRVRESKLAALAAGSV